MDEFFKDRKAWRSLLRRVARATSNAANAEDYLHTAFVRMEEYRKEKEVQSPISFLLRTAINISTDEKRRKRVRAEADLPVEEFIDLSSDEPLQNEAFLHRERLNHVMQGLAKLEPLTRDIFMMSRVDGLKYHQIASRLGISVSSVEKHVAKAVLFLAQWTEGW